MIRLRLRRLVPSKGIDIIIKAFKIVVRDFPHLKLLIAGEGSEENNLKALVRELQLEQRVKFIGTVTLPRAVSLLKGAICTVVPSISEGGGLVNVEAQAASCPVIASRVGGIPEYVQEGVSGLLFEVKNIEELADKLKIILSDISLRNKLILGGTKHAKKFSWDYLGPQYLALYGELIKSRSSEPLIPWSGLTRKLWLDLCKT